MLFGETELHDDELQDYAKKSDKVLVPDDEIRCFAFKAAKDSATLMARCNTIGTWFEANKAVIQAPKCFFDAEGIKIAAILNEIKGVDAKTTVDEEAQIGGMVNIKKSIIMKGAKIGNGAQISDSIICTNVTIGAGAVINQSIVGSDQVVADNTRIDKAVLQNESEMDID